MTPKKQEVFPVSSVSVIILAAGLSRRMGRDKLLLEYDGKTFLQRVIDLVAELPVFERIIVTSEARIGSVDIPPGFIVCMNPSPEDGLSGSIRTGVEAATGTHLMFLTADQPRLTVDDLLPLLKASQTNPDRIVYPFIDSKPCSPTIFPEKYRRDLLSLSGDNGGRTIRDGYKDNTTEINPKHPENFVDIDVKSEYERLFH